MNRNSIHPYLTLLWLGFLGVMLYIYFFHAYFFKNTLELAVATSPYLAYAFLLFLGSIRGFTLIPSTFLIIIGLLFFPPLPLFIFILLGILISSVSVYYFFEFLHLDKLFEKKHSREIAWVRSALQKNELPIIIGWSAFPFLPTDLICYICGTLRVDIKKFIFGILIGEGIISSFYIFFGSSLIPYLQAFF